jgi:NAD(P)-dependent dehydrogenase (short-subunit alcohol dehydrogenase family)
VAITANIASKENLQALVDEARARFGRIDILVCNAASNPYFGAMDGMSDDQFNKLLQNNIVSNHWLIQMVAPEMLERGDGSIVIISSIGGLRGSVNLGGYAITKAADMQLARNLAAEFGPKGVRVNAVCPGLVKTDFAQALWDNPQILNQYTANVPLRRIGTPDELAGIVVYLAAPAGAFTTGQSFVIDGGATAV